MFQLFTLLCANRINNHHANSHFYACFLTLKMFTILGTLYGWVLHVTLSDVCLDPGPFVHAYFPSLGIFYFVFTCIVCLGSSQWTQGMTCTQEIPKGGRWAWAQGWDAGRLFSRPRLATLPTPGSRRRPMLHLGRGGSPLPARVRESKKPEPLRAG